MEGHHTDAMADAKNKASLADRAELADLEADTRYGQKQKLDAYLPVTADRTAHWSSATIHNVTAIIGAGVLGLPYAMAALGWPGGVTAMVISGALSLYTLWQLTNLHHDEDGRRYDRYYELGRRAFNDSDMGMWLVIVLQLIVMLGLAVIYSVTGGTALNRIYHFYCNDSCPAFGLSAWISVFAACQLILSPLLPNFNSLIYLSVIAAICSLVYSTIAIGTSLSNGRQIDPETNSLVGYSLDGQSSPAGILNAFSALGTIAFAYGGHNVVLEIQACIPERNGMSTAIPYMRGVYICYAIIFWCYFGVSFAGYWAFGQNVASNVLFSLDHPRWLITVASMAVFLHVVGSYQLYSVPVFDMFEKALDGRTPWSPYSFASRLVYRSMFVVVTGFVAVSLPFFGDLMGFFGAFAIGPTTFVLPPIFWLLIRQPKSTSVHFWLSWICVVLGSIVTIVGSIGGLRGIILSASNYTFYM